MGREQGGCVKDYTQEDRIRLLLLDGQALLRTSLARFLASEPGLEVVGECGTSAEAIEMLSGSPVDVVLLDFVHATEGGEGFVPAACRSGYQGRFLIIAEAADASHTAAAIRLGASGIFVKSEAPERLVQAVRAVASGAAWIEPRMIRILAEQPAGRLPQWEGEERGAALPDREQRVLLGILAGLTNKKIGESLGLSEGSVKTSVQQLFYRTGVRTRGQLVRAALEGPLKDHRIVDAAG
jgi:DNA-binding NarL/FixJ family response regulator